MFFLFPASLTILKEAMTNELTQELNDVIKKTLPAHVGNMLAQELAELATLRVTVASLNAEVSVSCAINNELKSKLAKMAANEKTDAELAAKITDIEKRELRMELVHMQLKISGERREEIKGLVTQLFRSPMRTEVMNGNMPIAVPGLTGTGNYPGTPGTLMSGVVNTTVTKSES